MTARRRDVELEADEESATSEVLNCSCLGLDLTDRLSDLHKDAADPDVGETSGTAELLLCFSRAGSPRGLNLMMRLFVQRRV